jgi:hypothetical protein
MAQILMDVSIEMVTLVIYLVASTAGAVMWVGKLATRIAVLEAGYDIVSDTLQEIKTDIKELVNALHGTESAMLTKSVRRQSKKP